MEQLKEELDALKLQLGQIKKDDSSQKFVFTPKPRKVEKFSGRKGEGQSVYEFIDDIVRVLKTRPTSNEEKVDYLISHLDGPEKEDKRISSTISEEGSSASVGHSKRNFW